MPGSPKWSCSLRSPTKMLYAPLLSPIQNSLQDILTMNITHQMTLTFSTSNHSSCSATAAPETPQLLSVCSYGPVTRVVLGRWMSWARVQYSGYSTMSKWWSLHMCHLQCTDDTASNPTRSMMWDEISAPGTTRGAASSVWGQSWHWWLSRPVNKEDPVNYHSHNCAL
jgi:hypothetical protein